MNFQERKRDFTVDTLYISDLDGTLLTSKGIISDQAACILNGLTEEGMLFTVATARSASSAVPLLEKLRLRLPVILMNGAVIYDLAKKENVSVRAIPAGTARAALAAFERHAKAPFFTRLNNKELEVCFTRLNLDINRKYYEDRRHAPGKAFIQMERLTVAESAPPVYLALFDRYEELLPVARELSEIAGLSHVFYQDTYSDYWLIEAFSSDASKPAGAATLRDLAGARRMVAFGDNLNDLPLFAVCDESYAVANAHERVRQAATGVIASNEEDAVAQFLLERRSVFVNKK